MGAVEMEALSSPHFAAPFIVLLPLLFASSVSATMQQENGPESQEFGYSWFGNSRQLERVGITWRVA